ncbi:MAG: murein biosynthesis integral membrane protein MurJ [Rubrivivax sp.]
MNLLKAASTVSLLTLASKLTGLVRDQLIAAQFGAGALTDAFNVAFRLPNLLRRLFAEGAFSQAFVPFLAATREQEGDDATQALIDAVATVLLWALLGTCVLGVVAAPVLVWLMAAGLSEFDLAVQMARWMFPYIACMSLVALSAGILNTWKRFSVPALTPVLLNLSLIGAAWLGVPLLRSHGVEPVLALAAGVMLGGLLQLAVQVPALRRVGRLPRFGLAPAVVGAAWRHAGVRRILALMAPALLGVSVAQVSLLINTQIASQLGVGAVSWLFYADRLMEFPTGLLGVALGSVLLPQLAAAQGRRDADAYSALLDWGLRLVLLLALPCSVALLLFPAPLIAVLFHHGAFGANDVVQTAAALRGYGCGLLGLIAVKVLAPGFYAQQDTRTPVRIAIAVLLATQLLNLALVPWLGPAGLAYAIGLGALGNALFLLRGLLRGGSYRPQPGWRAFAARVLLACVVLAMVLLAADRQLDWIALGHHEWRRAGWMAAVLATAALAYLGTLRLAGVRLGAFMRRG